MILTSILKIIVFLLSFPKSICFCIKMLPFKTAIKLPIIIRYNTKISSCKGKIDIERKKFASIKIGFGGAGCFDKKYQRTILEIDGKRPNLGPGLIWLR